MKNNFEKKNTLENRKVTLKTFFFLFKNHVSLFFHFSVMHPVILPAEIIIKCIGIFNVTKCKKFRVCSSENPYTLLFLFS